MRRDRTGLEDIAVLAITSVAALATAWCGFEASIWSGEQTFALNDLSNTRRLATEARIEGDQMVNVDVAQFLAWVDARFEGETSKAAFLEERFRPGLKAAMDDWLEGAGPGDPIPPKHPFGLPSYTVPPWKRAEDLNRKAESQEYKARRDNHQSDRYMLGTVLMAAVLFFASSGPRRATPRLQHTFLTLAALLLVAALVFMLAQPIALSSPPSLEPGGESSSS